MQIECIKESRAVPQVTQSRLGYLLFSIRHQFSFRLFRTVAVSLAATFLAFPLQSQAKNDPLTQNEIEQIRQARYVPSDCIGLYVKFLDVRMKQIQQLYAKRRRPGREDDTRELMNQFTALTDELSENVDDYGQRHADLRKALPKLIDATERWTAAMKAPQEDSAYEIPRKMALESIRDLRESATQLLEEQITWFKANPPAKQEIPGTIDIPR